MAVGEDIRLDNHSLAFDALDGESTAVDHRPHGIDNDSLTAFRSDPNSGLAMGLSVSVNFGILAHF